MKRRVDEIAYSTARAGTTPAHHRIITSPQHTNNNNNNNSPAATQIQYQIAMKNDGGPPANLVNQPPQSIQYTSKLLMFIKKKFRFINNYLIIYFLCIL